MIIKYLGFIQEYRESFKMPKHIDHTADTPEAVNRRTGNIIRDIAKKDILNKIDGIIKEFLLKIRAEDPMHHEGFLLPNLICVACNEQDANEDVDSLTFIPFIRVSDNLDKVTIKILNTSNGSTFWFFSVFMSLMFNDLAIAIERNVKDMNIHVEYEIVQIAGMDTYEKSLCLLGCTCLICPDWPDAETFYLQGAGSIFSPNSMHYVFSFAGNVYWLHCGNIPPEYYKVYPDSTGKGKPYPLRSYTEFFNRVSRITEETEVVLQPNLENEFNEVQDIEGIIGEIISMNSNDLVYAGGLQKISYINLQNLMGRLDIFQKILRSNGAISKLIKSALPVGIIINSFLLRGLSLVQFNAMSGWDVGYEDFDKVLSENERIIRDGGYCIIHPDIRTIEFADRKNKKKNKNIKCYKL